MPSMEEAIIKRVPPHSTEAEQSVIGAMLIDSEAIATAGATITGADFYNRSYGVVFDAMVELYNDSMPVDIITLQNRLREKDVPPEVASLEFIKDLMSISLTAVNIKHYATIVAEKSTLRKLIRLSEEVANNCYAVNDSLVHILDDAQRRIFELMMKSGEKDFVPINVIVGKVIDNIRKASERKGSVTGLATGFTDIDYKTAGLQPSDLILLAARPSMGKTALALNIAQHVAFKQKESLVIFSLEMSREQLVSRLLSMEARIDSQNIRTGNVSDSDWLKLFESAGIVGKSNMIIDDTPGISIPLLRSKCRKYKMEHKISLVIIDYLQLMSGSGARHSDSRQQEISDISRALKALARELDVPVIALSQLSRAVETRPDHRPVLSDLRDSGAIEQDADVVMFLYREEYYKVDVAEDKKNTAELIIAKQRNGPIGTVTLNFKPSLTRFTSVAY